MQRCEPEAAWLAHAAVFAQQLFAVFRNRNDHPETRDGFPRDVAAIDRVLPDPVIGCRATQSCTGETCALLQQLTVQCPCRRAAGHQVREVACIGIVVPTPVQLQPAMHAGFSTI